MKKSVYIAKLEQRLGLLAAQMAAAATEEAGVVWDPEEEPLPERLEIKGTSERALVEALVRGQHCFVFSIESEGWALSLSERSRIAAEAVRRWNVHEKIREHVLPAATIERALCCEFARAVLAILDGKGVE